MIINPTFGSDFEAFVESPNGIIPVTGLLGGTKSDPLEIGNDCFRQEDNVCCEFNTKVVQTEDEWIDSIQYCIKVGNEILDDNKLVLKSSHEFDFMTLMSDESLMTFGCEPAFDAYNDGKPIEINMVDALELRSAGFHIHVGFEGNIEHDEIIRFIQLMDHTVGKYSVEVDDDTKRRILYGKAGEYRFKHTKKDISIIEYRSVGTGAANTEEKQRQLFRLTNQAIDLFNEGVKLTEEQLIKNQQIINTCQKQEKSQYTEAFEQV